MKFSLDAAITTHKPSLAGGSRAIRDYNTAPKTLADSIQPRSDLPRKVVFSASRTTTRPCSSMCKRVLDRSCHSPAVAPADPPRVVSNVSSRLHKRQLPEALPRAKNDSLRHRAPPARRAANRAAMCLRAAARSCAENACAESNVRSSSSATVRTRRAPLRISSRSRSRACSIKSSQRCVCATP